MGVLKSLFGWNRSIEDDISFDENFVTIKSIDYFGWYKISKSGEWIISWIDSDMRKHVGGYRESGYGRYVLYNTIQNTVVVQGKMERPNHGAVANNGCFSLEDWRFGGGLTGTFYVISPDGEILIEKKLNANLYNSAISEEGKYAVCQTANNPKSDDGNRFTAFDVERRQQLFSITPVTGWADEYRFDEGRAQILAVHKNIGQFRYDISGKFLDYAAFESARLNCDQYHVVLGVIKEKLANPELSVEQLDFILFNVKRAMSLGADKDTGWNGLALKFQGNILERVGKPKEALTAYEAATKANDKIGLKRKIAALKKQLQ